MIFEVSFFHKFALSNLQFPIFVTTQQLCTKQGLKPGKEIYPQISQMDADEKTHNSGLV